MPITIERLDNEPILMITWRGMVSADALADMYSQTLALMADSAGRIYRIVDFREAETTFAEIFALVQGAGRGTPGSASDPRLVSAYVGTDSMIRLGADLLKRRSGGAVDVMLFRTIEDAVAAMRVQVAADANGSTQDAVNQ